MPGMVIGALVVASLACAPFTARAEEDEHAEHLWEWAGTFDFEAADYIWTFARRGGSYADPSMQLTIHSATGTDEAALEALEEDVEDLWNTTLTWTEVGQGDSLVAGTPYRLVFDQNTWFTQFRVSITSPGAYAAFAEHVPLEFESDFHYLSEEDGHYVEPIFEEGAGEHDHGDGDDDDDHDGHDHGDDGDDHDGHDHGDDGDDHDGHDHDLESSCPWTHPWEWAGVADLPAGTYTWTFAMVDGAYADDSMKMLIMDAGALPAMSETLHVASETAASHWDNATWQSRQSGQELVAGGEYTLNFDQDTWMTYFTIEHTGGTLAFFAQHIPLEFESTFHFFRDQTGEDVEMGAEEAVSGCGGADEESNGRMGEVLLGSFLTVLPTLCGICAVAYAVPGVAAMAQSTGPSVKSFSSGAVSAAAVFLMLPESYHLVDKEYYVGIFLLIGWASGLLSHHLFGHTHAEKASPAVPAQSTEEGQGASPADVEAKNPKQENGSLRCVDRSAWAVAFPVLFGDALHNLSDGLVIGAAFRSCSTSFAWELIGVTIAHELPQELADVVVLIQEAGFSWPLATLMNFISGLTCVLGAAITYSADTSYNTQGLILAYGAGVYLFVAMTELSPSMVSLAKRHVLEVLKIWLPFMIGATCIGLVLINHEHCEPETSDGSDPHAGHNH